jgi:methyl coenzyme M reductase alpha subunit
MAMDMADPRSEPSRRSIITTAGVAAVAGAGIVAGTGMVAIPAAASDRLAGTGQAGGTVVEFRGRISQTGTAGEDFTSYGFLIKAAGLTTGQLFSGSQTLGSALFTAYATGALTARVLDQSVHSLDIEGTLTVYQRAEPGASFADPNSFRTGRPVAGYRLSLQDVLAVFAPQQGISHAHR